MTGITTALAIADWRARIFGLYADVRSCSDAESPETAHRLWQDGRNRLFREHPASPLDAAAQGRFTSLKVAPYQPAYRFEATISDEGSGQRMDVPTGTDGIVPFERLGTLSLPGLGHLALWRLTSYAGGLFLPLRDATAGAEGGSYGGGRYLLDTVKGAYLGEGRLPGSLVLDLNFSYNPSCAYDEAWACPLPGTDNRLDAELAVGELHARY
ncbi:uncharacterized protein (DUF1684 family) [Arthrobacter sp. CAN_A214]|uniref:DUF1684 domain-containing protein n=1 Tax=Arthrobacter sp. CAN_A214 TaxID=2787720 RepID=UPI0018C901C7